MEKEIEKALKELEEELKWTHNDGVNLTKYDESLFNVIKLALTTKSKKEQAFDIIVAKRVDMYRLVVADTVVPYNNWTEFDEHWLTEEEFDLLKEVLENEKL
jgi:thiamine biosynthesis lipoprotein ApbE